MKVIIYTISLVRWNIHLLLFLDSLHRFQSLNRGIQGAIIGFVLVETERVCQRHYLDNGILIGSDIKIPSFSHWIKISPILFNYFVNLELLKVTTDLYKLITLWY